MMKKVLVVASVLGLASAFAVQADKGGENRGANVCKTSTLKGTYVYRSTGVVSSKEYAEIGTEVYDGRGNVTGIATDSDDDVAHNLVGTYSINADCTGTVHYTAPVELHEDIVLGPKGDTFTFIDRSGAPGEVLSGQETRQSN